MIGVGFLTAFGGLAMLGQDVVIASHFAVSSEVDAYQLALSVPTLLVNVLAGGTVLALLVPKFSGLAIAQHDHEIAAVIRDARRALGRVLAVCVLGWLALHPLFAPPSAAFSGPSAALTTHLLWLVTPILYFVGVASVDLAYLNSRGRFFAASMFPALMPLGAISFTLLFFEPLNIYAAAAGILFGSICHFAIGRGLTRRLLPKRIDNYQPATSYKLGSHYIQNVISSASLAGIILTDVVIASRQGPGDLAVYNYASRPVALFLAFFTASIGNVILTTFSRLVNQANWHQLRQRARFWICMAMFISFVSATTWICACEQIVALLYQRGAFHASDTQKVTEIQQLYLLQVPFYLTAVVGVRLLNSLGFHRLLAFINSVAFLVNLAGDIWLAPSLGLKGITIGTNIAFVVWAILVVGCAVKAVNRAPSIGRNMR